MSKKWDIFRKSTNPERNPVAIVHELDYHSEWMEDEFVTINVSSPKPINFEFGDYLTYRGEQFVIDYNPNVIKKARKNSYGEAFVYENVKLYSLARELNDVAFKDYVLNWDSESNNKVYSSQGKFDFFAASVEDLADRLQANLDRASVSKWTVLTPNYRRTKQRVTFDDSLWLSYYHPSVSRISDLSESQLEETKGNRDFNISIDNHNCRGALVLSYKNFGLSFIVRNRVIVIGAPAVSANKIFKYGKGNGLYEIEKTCDDSQSVVTKLYAYGSSKNLPLNYYANLHKYFYATITSVESLNFDYNYAEFVVDIPYMAGLFSIRNFGPDYITYQKGWVVKIAIDGVEITGNVENLSRDPYPNVRIYLEQRTESEDPGDEPDLEKLVSFMKKIEVGARVTFTAGFDKNLWPQDHIGNESEEQYPTLLSITNLMLPGFPALSLDAWMRKVSSGAIHSETISQEEAAGLLTRYIFSDEVMSPWIKSKNVTEIGEKEGSVYFDGSSEDLGEIMPSIEGTGAGVVTTGSQITDNGFLGEKADSSFVIRVAASGVLKWDEVYESKQEDIYIEMKSGFCTGRKFRLINTPSLIDDEWELKLEREQDNSIGRYFPYYDNNISYYCQILSGDTFIVTGLQMPSSYVEAAAAKLLKKSCSLLDTIDEPKVTYLPKVDEIYMARQHEEAKADNGRSLHDTLMSGMCITVEDEDLDLNLTSYIDNLNIKENGNNGIPTYDVVLRDDKDVSDIQRTIDIVGGMSGLEDILSQEEITRLIKQIGNASYLSKIREDETYYLITFWAGILAERMIQSPNFKLGEWSKDEDGEEHNDGEGFSIWKNAVDAWIMEIDYATVRHLLRAKELYTQTAHIGEVTNQTIFKVGLQTLGNILIGKYAEGVEGGIITPEGHVEINTLITRGLAKLQELFVVNDSTFGGSLSSIDFISDFLGGKGWAIQKKTRINAEGVEEEYYALEIDNVTVRNTLRVYEMVISQLRGEFDNYVFAAMMEVHHYDAATGKVWLVPQRNQRAVSFKEGDYIKVQQYLPGNDVVSGGNGYIIKSYELIITEAGTGGKYDENGERLDWVTFKNFVSDIEGGTPATLITEKDTFVRLDNETDPERKGLMQIITVGPNTPYQDVYYGMKTDPNNAMKLRIGNLSGVRTDLFGWLEEYGAYLPNLYAVGKMFNRQTGESYNSSLEITRERLKSVYTETVFNISDEDNFLKNGFFANDMEAWTTCAVDGDAAPSDLAQQTINSGDGTPLMVNGAILAYQNRLTAKVTEWSGMKVLHLLGMGIYQNFSDIKANGTHKENKSDNDQSDDYTQTKDVANRLYIGIRILPISSGTLKVTFMRSSGSVIAEWSKELNASHEWSLEQAMDSDASPWAYTGETGRMILSYTGECYIRFVALITDPVVNSRETYETMIEQTSRRITLEAAKQTADLNREVARIDLAYNEITSTVTNNWDRTKDAFSQLGADLTKEGEELAAQYGILATFKAQTDAAIVSVAANFDEAGNIKAESKIDQKFNSITTEVSDNKKASDDAFDTLKKYFGFDVRTDTPEDQYVNYATWREQTAKYTGEWAAAFDEGGKLAKYSATVQTAEALERIVVGEGNASSYTGDTLTKIISDNSKAQQDMNSIFSDEIIDSEEMGALIAMMKSLTASYDEAIAAYTAAKEDKNLPSDSTEATALKTASDTLVTKFNDLKTAISDLITYKEGNAYVTKKTIDGQDVYVLKKGAADSINEKFTAFNTALKDLSTAMENAGIKINNSLAAAAAEAKKTIDDYIKNLDDQIKEKYPDLNFLTYTKETATSISEWAVAFDEGGKLAKYSATVQTAEGLKDVVGDTTKDQFSTMLQKCGIISGTVSSYDSILDGKANAKDLDDKANKSDLKDYEKTVDWASKLSGYATSGQLGALSDNVTAKVQKVAQRGILLTENEWEQGNTTNENPGQQWGDSMKTSSTTKLRTKRLIGVTSLTRITLSSNYRAGFVYFDKNERVTAQKWGGWQSPNSNGIISVGAASNVAYVIILLKKVSEETISPGEVVDAEFSITSDTIVTQGEISLFLTEDDLSNVSIKADNIDFEFSKRWSVKAKGKGEVMYLTTDGNLYLKGNIYGGNLTGDLMIGTGSNKMYIRPNESNGAELVGVSGSKEVINLGFVQGDSGYEAITPQLSMSYVLSGSSVITSVLKPYYLSIKNSANGKEGLLMADRLSVNGSVWAEGYIVFSGSSVYSGVDGSFTAGSKTVTVKKGIITEISS